jgi:L-ascorbate metabolism protein UlaG (beta-lactamase superfamily)
MRLTKYEHACFSVEIDDVILVVDPGNFTSDFVVTDNIIAIVITHEHADHFDPDLLAAIYDKNPESVLISLPSIIEKMPDHKSQAVIIGQTINIGPFNLEFFGGEHAAIHPDIPVVDNVGVMINDCLYYPGDSFSIPTKPVKTLALPVSAPWMKTSEMIDFLRTVRPVRAFPTHDAILSVSGMLLADTLARRFADPIGVEYKRIDGTTIDV